MRISDWSSDVCSSDLTLTPGCSFFVLDRAVSWARVGGTMRADRLVRLLDLEPYEVVIVNCQCGRSVEYPNGLLQRRPRLPSDTLVYDLQSKLRCQHCRRTSRFRIAFSDHRQTGQNTYPGRSTIKLHGTAETPFNLL